MCFYLFVYLFGILYQFLFCYILSKKIVFICRGMSDGGKGINKRMKLGDEYVV